MMIDPCFTGTPITAAGYFPTAASGYYTAGMAPNGIATASQLQQSAALYAAAQQTTSVSQAANGAAADGRL